MQERSRLERVCLKEFLLLPFIAESGGVGENTVYIAKHAPGWTDPEKQDELLRASSEPLLVKKRLYGSKITGLFYNKQTDEEERNYSMLELERFPGIYFSSVNFSPAVPPGSVPALLERQRGDMIYLLPLAMMPVSVRNGKLPYRAEPAFAEARKEAEKYRALLEKSGKAEIEDILYGSDSFEGYYPPEKLPEDLKNSVTAVLIKPEGFDLYFTHHNFDVYGTKGKK